MARNRKHSRVNPSDAAALLTQAEPALEAFVAAIGSVSPTRLPLAPEEKAARYQLKAQLQTRAIELHAARLTVRRAGVGVVGLGRNDGGRGDLGHAPLARLGAAARRWALAQLEAARPSVPAVNVDEPAKERP